MFKSLSRSLMQWAGPGTGQVIFLSKAVGFYPTWRLLNKSLFIHNVTCSADLVPDSGSFTFYGS